MLLFIIILITVLVLRKTGIYNKSIGDSGFAVKHIVNVILYTVMICICPICAIVIFLIFDAKPLYNKLKEN